MILKGKPVADNVVRELIHTKKPDLKFVAVQVGSDEISSLYVKKKQEFARSLKVNFEVVKIESGIQNELECAIRNLNDDESVGAIMVQMPLPIGFNREKIANLIAPEKDIDGFSFIAGRTDYKFLPPTVLAIDEILNFYKIDKSASKILIVGLGFLVGRPLLRLWQSENLDVTILDENDNEYFEKIKAADIVILATGCGLKLKAENFTKGASVIDASTVSEEGSIKGDVEFDSWDDNINLAPVPGGVGPVTIAMLFKNFYRV